MFSRLSCTTFAVAILSGAVAGCAFDRTGIDLDSPVDASSATDASGAADAPGALDAAAPSSPPVGQWTFNAGQELRDLQGNFPDLVLRGSAEVTDGTLDIDGSGTSADGWAVTGADLGLYSGPPIVDKTLVAWLRLRELRSDDGVWAGSAITIDRESIDHFDGVIFAEREEDRWMSGSSGFDRTVDFSPGFQETETDTELLLVITYDDRDDAPGGDMDVTGYRNGVAIGNYATDDGSSWATGDAEVFFGTRHGTKDGGPGALNAVIDEARIYDRVLSPADIAALTPLL